MHPAGSRRALRHDRGAGGRPRPPRRARPAAAAAEAVPEGLPGGRVDGDPRGARGHLAARAFAGAGRGAAADVGAGGGLRQPDGRPAVRRLARAGPDDRDRRRVFITAFPRRDALRSAAQIKAGSTLDESVARLVAHREGIKVVLSGSIEAQGARYAVSGEGPAARRHDTRERNGHRIEQERCASRGGRARVAMRRELGDTAQPKPGEWRRLRPSLSKRLTRTPLARRTWPPTNWRRRSATTSRP